MNELLGRRAGNSLPVGKVFRNYRQLAAWLGLTPSLPSFEAPDSKEILALFGTLDNAQFPVDGLAQYAKRFLIRRTIMRGDRLCDAVELNKNSSLTKAAFIDLRRDPAREEAPASRLKGGAGELGISGESLRVVNRTVCRNPVRFGHGENDRDGG